MRQVRGTPADTWIGCRTRFQLVDSGRTARGSTVPLLHRHINSQCTVRFLQCLPVGRNFANSSLNDVIITSSVRIWWSCHLL